MSLVSFFKGKCNYCGDEYEAIDGKLDECHRCATVVTLIRPLSLIKIAYLLDAAASADRGTFKIVDSRFQKGS